jgi:hypothetical protein
MRWSRNGADVMLAVRTQVLGREYGTIARDARVA